MEQKVLKCEGKKKEKLQVFQFSYIYSSQFKLHKPIGKVVY